jgi:hypothetical protein
VGFFVLDTAAAGANLVIRTEEGEMMTNQQQAKYLERILQDRVIGKPVHIEDATMSGDWSRVVVKNSRTEIGVAHVNVVEFFNKPFRRDALEQLIKQVEGAQH